MCDQYPKLIFFAGASFGVAATLLYSTLRRHDEDDIVRRLKQRFVQEILPDLVQVHLTIRDVAESFRSFSDLRMSPPLASDEGRQWMFTLMPIWNWRTEDGAPIAAEFWKLAHAVSRDQDCNDWVAPHITLHSRSKDVNGLADKFCRLLSDLGTDAWEEILSTLRDEEKWTFDDDHYVQKPSTPHHHVLHKGTIEFPEPLRAWFEDNQNHSTLIPRKQDKADNSAFLIPIKAPLHISLYSFRAARLDENTKGFGVHEDKESLVRRTQSYSDPRAAHHRLPTETDVLTDLTQAEWTLVFFSPGRTDSPAIEPKLLAAVRLSDLASDALKGKLDDSQKRSRSLTL